MREDRARPDRGTSHESWPIGIAGAEHDLTGIKAEHSGNELGKDRLMTLAARSGHAVKRHLMMWQKTDCDLVFGSQSASRRFKKYAATDPAQRAAPGRLLAPPRERAPL